ncbi:Double-strand-break repair protein rad21-like protein 1 [Euphorbia peplus]|nr:Double-strand-break repair protein rad21-like protein 1 [Euphorbia peplus]
MFFSQTFLARKGPLGTVWCAAHLQHRLKKSHYTSTDISSTVDSIMFPDIPIALRMSGHLLVGVVRIYSKKVDYLFQDCFVARLALEKAFASTKLNLPDNATSAKFDSVTLPQTFDLDDFQIDVDMVPDRFLDDHTRSTEEITLQDHIHIDVHPYVEVTFEDDMFMDILPPENDDLGVRHSTLEDTNTASPRLIPSNQVEVPATNVLEGVNNHTAEGMDTGHLEGSNQEEPTNDFQDLGQNKETEDLNTAPNDTNSPPEIEVMRDESYIPENIQPFEDLQTDILEPNRSLNRGLDEKGSPAPFEDVLPFQEETSPFGQRTESPNFMHSNEESPINDTLDLSGHIPSELKIRSTPPVQSPKPRQRKRKHFFDDSTVLSNKSMKKALENTSDILRKRREIPSTSLGIWKMNNSLRKENIFSEPSLTGCCANILHLFEKDFVSSKPHLTLERLATPETPETMVIEPPLENEPTIMLTAETSSAVAGEVIPEVRNETSVPTPEVFPEPMNVTLSVERCVPEYEAETDVEIEHLRHADSFDGNNIVHELVPSPDRAVHSPQLPSPLRRDDFTPHSPKSIGSETVHFAETSAGTSLLHSQGYTAEVETPWTDLEREFDTGNFGLSYIPESGNIPETEDLSFLEADNSPFAGSAGTQGIDSLSVRTRAVAQYLLRQSQQDVISLNKILEGKTRKLCARMFFETLVLKTNGQFDVRQEQPYGDISLKPTSTLTKSPI